MKAHISKIEFVLPNVILGNEELAAEFPPWTPAKIQDKTGICKRHLASPGECASDLAEQAAQRLFATGVCKPGDVDYLLFCTQSPDYFIPTTACLLQDRLKLPNRSGALDFNLGCSGFVYGLGLAKALIESGQSCRVLLLTAETYSKHIHPGDKSVRTIFGDAAAAVLVEASGSSEEQLGSFVYGTDGSGAFNLIVPTGGMRNPVLADAPITEDENGNRRTINNLYMNGQEIFHFTLRCVPETVAEVLKKSGRTLGQIDLFVFHQANQYMLEHLRKKLAIPSEKFWISMAECGNTVSATIPIALKQAEQEGKLKPGHLVMVLGFGVGYSWAGALIRWG